MSRMRNSARSLISIDSHISALLAALAVASCANTAAQQLKPIDKVLAGVSNPAMQEKWHSAEAAGTLPPIDAIPAVSSPLAVRRPVMLQVVATAPQRPLVQPQTVATVLPFSSSPVVHYAGAFQVTSHTPGVLIGVLNDRAAPLELYYKLPGDLGVAKIKEQTSLNLLLRDEVLDAALQRRVVLYDERGIAPFALIAEGSRQRFKQTIEPLQLTIEQLAGGEARKGGERYLPVKISYGNDVLTLKPGERGKIGAGGHAVEAYVIESLSVDGAMLREGQPYYINVMLYRPSE
ncbi:MAG: hypothetical protein WA632_13930 [Gallionella sp.]